MSERRGQLDERFLLLALAILIVVATLRLEYLLGTVHSNGEIQFVFKEIKPGNIPPQVVGRYGSKQVQACFAENKSTYAPEGPSCTASVADDN